VATPTKAVQRRSCAAAAVVLVARASRREKKKKKKWAFRSRKPESTLIAAQAPDNREARTARAACVRLETRAE
jgi:hypothetical protein